VTTPEAGEVLQPGDHGSTFAGGPLAASVALTVLELVDHPELLRAVRETGAGLRERLLGLDGVREVRGRGLMLGVGLEEGIDAPALALELLRRGLIVNAPEPDTLRLLPPLVIGEPEAERAVELISGALDDARSG
jgi:acetylornithine/succinyldiaminopimelate/putrescine aminotransferase